MDSKVEEEFVTKPVSRHRISVAPMLGVTNIQFRYLFRLLTRETTLYTDMIHHETVLYNDYKQILEYNDVEHPIVIQLGGSEPDKLGLVAKYCKELGYDEINLNCGCPSSKVQENNFGAVLMNDPELVAECTTAIYKQSGIEVTVKCRLGLDKDNDDFLYKFIETVNAKGSVNHFIMHARLAIMKIDPVKNRSVPPLNYKKVFDIRNKYQEKGMKFSINGGFREIKDIEDILKEENGLEGCMIGRAAYDNPWMFADFDRRFYGKKNIGLTRREVLYRYSDFIDEILLKRPGILLFELTKPILYIMNGERFSTVFKNELTTVNKYMKDNECTYSDFIKHTIDMFEKCNPNALERSFAT